MLTSGSLTRFAEQLADTADVKALGDRYLAGAREFVDVPGLGFDLIHPRTHALQYADAAGVSPYFLSRYEAVGRAVDPLLERVIERRAPVAQWHVMSRRAWCQHPIYRQVYHLHAFVSVIQAPVVADGDVVGVLSFGGRAGLRDRDVAVCEVLGVAVGKAIEALRARDSLEAQRAQLGAALDLCDEAVVITDLRSGRRWLNRSARTLLRQVAAPRNRSPLDDIMAEHLHAEQGWTSTSRVRLKGGGSSVLEVRTVPSPTDGETVISLITFRGAEASPRLPAGVAGLLSPREREVAECAAEGLSTREISERLALSAHTVKEYLKSVYRKLGISSRVDIARLAVGAPAATHRRTGRAGRQH